MGQVVKLKLSSEYVSNRLTYQALADFTDGTLDRVRDYLVPYATETGSDPAGKTHYANRQRRSYNTNWCEPYLTIHLGHLSQPIQVSGVDSLGDALADIDGKGTSLEKFVRDVLWHYMRDGLSVALVERPAAIASTKAEARASRERSYSERYDACHVLKLERFASGPRRGMLKDVMLQTGVISDDIGKKYAIIARYQLEETGPFTYTRYKIAQGEMLAATGAKEIDAEVLDTTPGGLDRIPLVVFGAGPDESFLKSVMPLNNADYNLTSLMSNINYNQGFQRSFVTGAKKEEVSKSGEHLITLINNEGARIFTIEAGNPEAIKTERDALRREINRRGRFEFNQLSDDTRAVQSSESKEKDLITRRGIYDDVLDQFEDGIAELLSIHAEYESASASPTVSIVRDYGLEDQQRVYEEEDSTAALARQVGADSVIKEILKARVRRMRVLPEGGETEEQAKERLFADIDAAQPAASTAVSTFTGIGALRQ